MRDARAALATIVLGTTVAGALWLYLYRETSVVEYIGYTFGVLHEFHAPVLVRDQPWWSVPAAVSLVVVGIALTLWLLPEWRRPLRRFVEYFGNTSEAR